MEWALYEIFANDGLVVGPGCAHLRVGCREVGTIISAKHGIKASCVLRNCVLKPVRT